jgi:hypothetical protein
VEAMSWEANGWQAANKAPAALNPPRRKNSRRVNFPGFMARLHLAKRLNKGLLIICIQLSEGNIRLVNHEIYQGLEKHEAFLDIMPD